MKVLRTSDERFSDLPDFAFAHATWTSVQPLRCGMHYLDEGPCDAAPVLLMHAEPSWCFLYRKMIPPLAARGHRAVAPDLIGFGRPDKPINRSDYSFERHVDWMSDLLVKLDLRAITQFCQDWGGPIGVRLVARFSGALRCRNCQQNRIADRWRTDSVSLQDLAGVQPVCAATSDRLADQ